MNTHGLPWSQACENNKAPILEVLEAHLGAARRVLEIGSGTGQHAVHFARGLPHLTWLTSDRPENHAGIRQWIDHEPAANLEPPFALDVTHEPWPSLEVDAVYSANTAHIMGWPAVEAMFRGVAGLLPEAGVFLLYGPFNYAGLYTSPGNERFDTSLRSQEGGMGIRDFDDVSALARGQGLVLHADHAMPANNRTLVFAKT